MKKSLIKFIAALFSISMVIGLFFSGKIPSSAKSESDYLYPFDEFLVKYRNESAPRLLTIRNTAIKQDLFTRLEIDSDVEYIEPNFVYKASVIPSDTEYNKQWYLKKIKAPEAWDKINSSPYSVIAIIDSGVQITHPDLRDNIWLNRAEVKDNGKDDDGNGFIDDIYGWDFVSNKADPSPKFDNGATLDGLSHGTLMAGIAAASGNNAAGVSGVTWRAQIMPLRVLSSNGEGKANNVIRAIDYAVSNGADIINLSFNGFDYSQGMYEAVKRAYEAGVIVVAAAGNEEGGKGNSLDKKPMYPVCYDGPRGQNWVIGVAATDTLDQKAAFSSYGFGCVDLAAPGVSAFGTTFYAPDKLAEGQSLNELYDGYWSGTSVATPMVSGAIALIQAANPEINRRQVLHFLLNSTDNIGRLNPDYLGQLGSGRLNIDTAITSAQSNFKSHAWRIAYAPASGKPNPIRLADYDGNKAVSILENDKNLSGMSLASSDLDADGKSELVVGYGKGQDPIVKTLKTDGKLIRQFNAYASNFRGGVNVAVGDVNGDGKDEIVTGPGNGGGPQIRVFDQAGKLKSQFFAYSQNFRGGVNVAVGDVNGDGKDEIVTGPGNGGGPHVRVFNQNGNLLLQFFAYDKKQTNGVKVGLVDLDNKIAGRNQEIITGPGNGGGSQLKVFDKAGKLRLQFLAFDKKFKGGLSFASADFDRDGQMEIVVGAGPGGAPHIRAYNLNGKLLTSFYGYEDKFNGGVNLAAIEL